MNEIKMECLLDADINKCPYYNTEKAECKCAGKCTFQLVEVEKQKQKYIRKERWYEQYYKK